jgi:hypothetical protein
MADPPPHKAKGPANDRTIMPVGGNLETEVALMTTDQIDGVPRSRAVLGRVWRRSFTVKIWPLARPRQR